jgi:hypothetical protein
MYFCGFGLFFFASWMLSILCSGSTKVKALRSLLSLWKENWWVFFFRLYFVTKVGDGRLCKPYANLLVIQEAMNENSKAWGISPTKNNFEICSRYDNFIVEVDFDTHNVLIFSST